MWEYVVGGATIFGLIVAVGAWLNGRVTRREISRLIAEEHRATRELIRKMDERLAKMDERLAKVDEGFAKMDERFAKMDERFAKIDERFAKIDERFAKMDERFEQILRESAEAHTKILEAIRELSLRSRRG